jgi:hypothetical protein
MTDPRLRWGIHVRWQARADWSLADGADRIAGAMRALAAGYPGHFDRVEIGDETAATDVGGEDFIAELVERLRASRNRNLWSPSDDQLGDAAVSLLPSPWEGIGLAFDQVVTGAGWHDSSFQLRLPQARWALFTDDPARVVALIDELATIFEARNAWWDMVHVRQDWNRWHSDCPVYGWATWLHPDWATVDTTGLRVDDRPGSGGGRLLVLPEDPLAMADPDGTVGRDTIRELARRTVFTDGRRLIDVNNSLAAP